MQLLPGTTTCFGCGLPVAGSALATTPADGAAIQPAVPPPAVSPPQSPFHTGPQPVGSAPLAGAPATPSPEAWQAAPVPDPWAQPPTASPATAGPGSPAARTSPRLPALDQNAVLLIGVLVVGALAAAAYFLTHGSSGPDHATIPVSALPTDSRSGTATQIANVKSNLRNLATAEETYLTDHGTYTPFITELTTFTRVPGSENQSLDIGVAQKSNDYCLVGSTSNDLVLSSWYLYDSGNGGLQPTSYPDAPAAEHACSDHSIKSF